MRCFCHDLSGGEKRIRLIMSSLIYRHGMRRVTYTELGGRNEPENSDNRNNIFKSESLCAFGTVSEIWK